MFFPHGSHLNSGNASAPEGNQAAFLQGGETSEITQLVGGFESSRNYQIVFQAAAGAGEKGARVAPVFEVFVDDNSLGVYQPATASYTKYATPPFRVAGKYANVRFVARNPDGSTITALLDNVRIIGSAPTVGADIRWLVTDHLGTPRMVVGLGGQLTDVTRHDYLPFGEEAGIGVGNSSVRVSGNGYGGDSVRMKFTGYERDGETGLDFAQSRYYSSVQGRFTSPDIFGGRLTNPQTLNLYAYVLNNPLKWADPSGHFAQDPKKKKKQEEEDEKSVVGNVGLVDVIDSTDEPSLLTSITPILGSYVEARHNFRTGHPIKGTFYTAMAISDIALLKSAGVGIVKLGIKAGGKLAFDETAELIVKESLNETSDDLVVVLGRMDDISQTALGAGEKRLLWSDNWNWEANQSVILGLAGKGVTFKLVTTPEWATWGNLLNSRGTINTFGREILTIRGLGYTEVQVQGATKLIPPSIPAKVVK